METKSPGPLQVGWTFTTGPSVCYVAAIVGDKVLISDPPQGPYEGGAEWHSVEWAQRGFDEGKWTVISPTPESIG